MTTDQAASPPGNRDAPIWPVVVAAAGPLILALASATPLGLDLLWVLVGSKIMLVFWAAIGVWAATIAVAAARRAAWRRAASAAVLPLAVAIVAIHPMNFVRSCHEWGAVLNFRFVQSSYRTRVATLPTIGQPKLVVFSRGGMPWASEGIVYDESDEILLPHGRQSSAWLQRASESELSCGYSVRPLGEHFYLGFFNC